MCRKTAEEKKHVSRLIQSELNKLNIQIIEGKRKLEESIKDTIAKLCFVVKQNFQSTEFITTRFDDIPESSWTDDVTQNICHTKIPSAIIWCLKNDSSANELHANLIEMVSQEIMDIVTRVRQTTTQGDLAAVSEPDLDLSHTKQRGRYLFPFLLGSIPVTSTVLSGVLSPFIPVFIVPVFIGTTAGIGLGIAAVGGLVIGVEYVAKELASRMQSKETKIKDLFERTFTKGSDAQLALFIHNTLQCVSDHIDDQFDNILPRIVQENIRYVESLTRLTESQEDVAKHYEGVTSKITKISLTVATLELRHQHLETNLRALTPVISDIGSSEVDKRLFYKKRRYKLSTGEIVDAYSCNIRDSRRIAVHISEIKDFLKLNRMMRNTKSDEYGRDKILTLKGACLSDGVLPVHLTNPTESTLWEYILQKKIICFSCHADKRKKDVFAQFLQFAQDVAEGVSFLHTLGISHGNLSIRNTLIGNGKRIMISGTGSTKTLGQMHFPGIPTHLAPEVIRGKTGKLSKEGDSYSLGILIWELWHGHQAYIEYSPLPPDTTPELFLSYITQGQRPGLTNKNGWKNAVIDSIIEDCWKNLANERSTVSCTLSRLIDARSIDLKADMFAQAI